MGGKIIAWILAVLMIVSMTGCGQAEPATIGETEGEMDLITELRLNKDERMLRNILFRSTPQSIPFWILPIPANMKMPPGI